MKAHLAKMQSRTTKPHLVSKTLDTILLLDHEKTVENTRIAFQSKYHHEIKDPKQIVAKLTIFNAFLTRKNTATKKSTSNRAARAVKLKEEQKEKPNRRLFPVENQESKSERERNRENLHSCIKGIPTQSSLRTQAKQPLCVPSKEIPRNRTTWIDQSRVRHESPRTWRAASPRS